MWDYNAYLVVHSHAPDDEAMNVRHRLNSGWYLARSNKRTMGKFHDKIVFASQSNISEQLCSMMCYTKKSGEWQWEVMTFDMIME